MLKETKRQHRDPTDLTKYLSMTISLIDFAFTAFYGKHRKMHFLHGCLLVVEKNIQILYNSGAELVTNSMTGNKIP